MNDEENKNSSQSKGIGKTILLIIFLAIITVVLLAVALFSKTNTKNTTPTVQTNANLADTSLTISPDLVKSSTSSAYKTDVLIDTGQDKVTSVQLELSFDPGVLTEVDIVPGNFFASPDIFLKTIDETNGRISYAIGFTPDQNGVSGKGVLATIAFSAFPNLKNVSTSVNFEPKTQVSGANLSMSLLKSSMGATFTLNKTLIATPSSTSIKTGSSSAQ